ncbi:uncharacterized protein F5Z01DRAFT_335654 [Emericellopsis atlantica]|uniref:Uncharacterized protein n=1 Tax=Emericellopsis atlantica TaxID=2614577 RepID=A0A9P7ZEX8_9HYPO|nr:uncharacterized protein F5Z01DRAFT_335654 [Emericellopsis atlantica]KAG9250894.1 hypothetical protein F5Z01DRAFT_335654 [Emericellopsis atlantica]
MSSPYIHGFRQAPYAEDQKYAKTILTTHVLERGLTTGAILGSTYTALRYFRAPDFKTKLLHNAGRGLLWSGPLMLAALWGRMRGREHIEWQDRSWRLLGNPFQGEVDLFTEVGLVAGTATYLGRVPRAAWTGYGALGAAGLGTIGGTVAYMAWRHGMHGGKFKEHEAL